MDLRHVNAAVHHDRGDMNALWPEFPCHALGDRTGPEFGSRKSGEVHATSDRRRRSCKYDRPLLLRQHVTHRFPAEHEGTEAAEAPDLLERVAGYLQQRLAMLPTSVVDRRVDAAMLRRDFLEQFDHL